MWPLGRDQRSASALSHAVQRAYAGTRGRGCCDAFLVGTVACGVAHGPSTPHMSLGERVAV
jgi:hypothetical protein